MENKNYTIKDIAHMAGVSAGTVDRVLHNRGDVSATSREKVQKVLDDLINKILNIGEEGKKAEKIAAFKYAVLTLNKMNEDIDGLIETVEREDLCILFDEIAFVAGLEPLEYGNGDGIASEWRQW